MTAYAIGVDIGGGSAKLGIISDEGAIITRHQIATPQVDTSEDAAAQYAEAVETLVSQVSDAGIQPVGIGVGLPGYLDEQRSMSTYSNVTIIDKFPLRDYLSDRFGLPVVLDNDATVAAVAESRFGAGRGVRRLLLVAVGTGIGLGWTVNGAPQRPTRGYIGDPGHLIVDPSGRWGCRQGCHGCLESVATSLALEREAAARATWQSDSPLGSVLREKGRLTAADVITGAQGGDPQAQALIAQVGEWLGLAAASWCYLYDPQVILIGGGMSAAGDLLIEPLYDKMQAFGMADYVAGVDVRRAQLGNDAGLIGAAGLHFSIL